MGIFVKYKFTNKRTPMKSLMAVVLALIGIVTIVLSIILAYKNGGEARLSYGAATLLSMVMALAGLILAIISRMEPDRYYFFPDLGIALNVLVLAACGGILALGLG
ncbi:MAG: hypothetical protein IJM34_11270 [Lachnospiraceae bacterium]|nr:hypothetical protein [Lachnospiraceae bacterium]